jgi:hypothetical protein
MININSFGKEKNFDLAFSRLRCSAHKLMIEEGRRRNIERNQRFHLK